MEQITPSDLDSLNLDDLVVRMDEILAAPYWYRRGNEIMKLRIYTLISTKSVKAFDANFQRKVAYKAFGLLLQLLYTYFSVSAQFFHLPDQDDPASKQIYAAARRQWTIVSSRIAFEYFIQIIFMLGTGEDFSSSKSAFKKLRKWLKQPRNPYTYFAITVARAFRYDREKRTPEVHAGTKMARHILLGTATDIDNEMLYLFNIIQNQWQFVIDIADDKIPNGWSSSGNVAGDREWYELWESGDQEEINNEIDNMFTTNSIRNQQIMW